MSKPEPLLALVERLDERWQECEQKHQYHDDFQDEWPRLSASIRDLVEFAEWRERQGTCTCMYEARDLLARLDAGSKGGENTCADNDRDGQCFSL